VHDSRDLDPTGPAWNDRSATLPPLGAGSATLLAPPRTY
jgi:hypothetical protein